MNPITAQDPQARSLDLVTDNIQRLQQLFPEAFNEGKVDMDVLRQLLGETVDERDEKYGLNWHGKRRARQLALTPSAGTLRPAPADSVDWDTTENLLLEGDNLEVLKLLQKSYAGQVKLIYIDPPYNTGKDFVYPDNFQDSIKHYQELTGQVEGGKKVTSNAEASGRFHTDWLNMMYPRLKIARNLMANDGVIFISIHYKELSNLKQICDEIFGEENLVGIITWKARVKPINIGEAKYRPQGETEYVLSYQRDDIGGKFQPLFTGGIRSYPHETNDRKYRLQTILKSNRGANYRSTMSFDLDGYYPPEGQRWQAGEDEIIRLNAEGYIEFKDGTPFRRYFEDEEGAEHDPFYCFMEQEWSSTSEAGKHSLNGLLGNNHGFDTVKPVRLIQTLIQSVTNPKGSEIVLDFFAGSGTTGNAVLSQNSEDDGNRKYILVQFPEVLDPDNKDQKTLADFCKSIGKPLTIAELTKERLRRAASKIKSDMPLFQGDTGFCVYKLDTTNILPWDPNPQDIAGSLFASEEHLKDGRTEQDILTELLLKLGLPLTVPIETRPVGSHTLYAVGAGTLMACLAPHIEKEEVEALAQALVAWQQELAPVGDSQVVLRDSAFRTDVAKANFTAILEQAGFDKRNIRSL